MKPNAAVQVAQRWMDCGAFFHATRSEGFSDKDSPDGGLYRFASDEVKVLLNVKQGMLSNPAYTAEEVTKRLRRAMQDVVSGYTFEDGVMVDYEALANSEAFGDWCVRACVRACITLTPYAPPKAGLKSAGAPALSAGAAPPSRAR